MNESAPVAPTDASQPVAAAAPGEGLSDQEVVQRSVGGAARTALVGLVCRAAGLLATVLVTHFLSQSEYGNANLAMIIALIVGTGALFSPQQALLTRHHGFAEGATLVHAFASWSGVLIAVVLALVREPLCAALHQPEAAPLLLVYCFALVLERLALIPMLRLRYQLRFGPVSQCELWGDLAYVGVTVATAAGGVGPVCLPLGMVARHGARLLYLARLREPLWPRGPQGGFTPSERQRAREIFTQSWPVHLGGFGEYLTLYLDNLLVGRLYLAAAQGLYAVAYTLIMTPTDTIALYGATALVRALGLKDAERRRATYLQGLRYMSLVLFPLAVGVALVASTVESTLLSQRWRGVAPLAVSLTAASLSTGLMRLAFAHLTAIHRVRLAGAIEAVRLLLFLLGLGAVAALDPGRDHLTWVGYGVSAAFMASSLIGVALSLRADAIPLRSGVIAVLPPLLGAAAMAAGLLLAQRGMDPLPLPPALRLLLEAAIGAALYVGYLRLCHPALFASALSWLRRRGR